MSVLKPTSAVRLSVFLVSRHAVAKEAAIEVCADVIARVVSVCTFVDVLMESHTPLYHNWIWLVTKKHCFKYDSHSKHAIIGICTTDADDGGRSAHTVL